ncbi:MAG: hypothetical protein ACRDPW_08660 [Mycobacteriales bacterium]
MSKVIISQRELRNDNVVSSAELRPVHKCPTFATREAFLGGWQHALSRSGRFAELRADLNAVVNLG